MLLTSIVRVPIHRLKLFAQMSFSRYHLSYLSAFPHSPRSRQPLASPASAAQFMAPCLLTLLVILTAISSAQAKLKVAASLPDFASIAAAVGGNQVEVFSIAKANSNPHFVELLPSFMVKVSRADLYLKVGLALDPWADGILDGSHNGKIRVVDCSAGIEVLDKPAGKVDASMGDVHPQGNPHYWLDPKNGALIADNIVQALQAVDPDHAELYQRNLAAFKQKVAAADAELLQKLAFMKDQPFITYHSSWAYLAHALGVHVIGYVEPFPGIPPTAKHLSELVALAKSRKAIVLIAEPYYPDKDAQFIARESGLPIMKFTPSCEGIGPDDYLTHFAAMAKALAGIPHG